MKLYIPPYLRTGKIPVLKQLYEMVASYSEEYTDKEELDRKSTRLNSSH